MALIPCPSCENPISTKARACPKCGHPIVADESPSDLSAPVTIEQTSKLYKGGQLIGVLMICGGVVACTSSAFDAAVPLLVIGVVVYTAARFGAWWNNG